MIDGAAHVLAEVFPAMVEWDLLRKRGEEERAPPWGTREHWLWWFAPRPGQPYGPLLGRPEDEHELRREPSR